MPISQIYATEGSDMLEVGQSVRYKGLGAGKVTDHVVRSFQGQQREFAVIRCPHREMTVQLPIGDPSVNEKLSPIASAGKLRQILRNLNDHVVELPRTWDSREELGDDLLRSNTPENWAKVVASYAYAEGAGITVASSDQSLLDKAKELLAGELACAQQSSMDDALGQVEATYRRLSYEASTHHEAVDSYASVDYSSAAVTAI